MGALILVLDLTEADVPEWHSKECEKFIPIRIGDHQLDFDVIEPMVTTQFIKEHRERSIKAGKRQGRKDWPIGFNVESIPYGAVIRILTIKQLKELNS